MKDAESDSRVTMRLANEGDAGALLRLAALDSAEPLEGPALLAEIDGEAVAALALGGGAAVADPFRHTTAFVAMLELRAAQIRGGLDAERSAGARLRARMRLPRELWLSR